MAIDPRALSDDALKEKIAKFEGAIEEVALGGGVGVIAGENRRMEIVQANSTLALNILDVLYRERASRWPDEYPARGGRAIGVRILP